MAIRFFGGPTTRQTVDLKHVELGVEKSPTPQDALVPPLPVETVPAPSWFAARSRPDRKPQHINVDVLHLLQLTILKDASGTPWQVIPRDTTVRRGRSKIFYDTCKYNPRAFLTKLFDNVFPLFQAGRPILSRKSQN